MREQVIGLKHHADPLSNRLRIAARLRNIIAIAVSLAILIVAGFGIYNIMNMTVNEKMREIAILKAMGFPTNMFTVLFAIGRTVGWIAHWKEMLDGSHNKIGRPRQLYIGAQSRPFKAVETRTHSTGRINWSWLWGQKKNSGNPPE